MRLPHRLTRPAALAAAALAPVLALTGCAPAEEAPPAPPATTTAAPSPTPTPAGPSPEEVIAAASERFAATVVADTGGELLTGAAPGTIGHALAPAGQPWWLLLGERPDLLSVTVLDPAEVSEPAFAERLIAEAGVVFAELGLSSTEVNGWLSATGERVACTATPGGVACLDPTALAEAAAAAAPLLAPLPRQEGVTALFGVPEVHEGGASGYRNAGVALSSVGAAGGAFALIYQTPDAPWQLFFSGQQGPACDRFDSEELRLAFSGQRCLNPSTGESSTVTAP